MATFTNQASLSYNGIVTNSNVIIGELQEVLSANKNAVSSAYAPGNDVTYLINLINSGTTAFPSLTVTDNLGAYAFGEGSTLVPLAYVEDSAQYYVNGVPQAAPAVSTAGGNLVFSGLSLPAGANATLVYETTINQFAPPGTAGRITNQAVVSGTGVTAPLTITETVPASGEPSLSISKSLSPTTVTENGQLTYTFLIQNTGNTAAVAADNVILTDTFDPILNPISVTFNGTAWSAGANYTYSTATGVFATLPGQITVPAATYTQNPVTGAWSVNPGVSTLVITGTV